MAEIHGPRYPSKSSNMSANCDRVASPMRGRLSHTETADSPSTLFFVFLHSRVSHRLLNAPSLPSPAPAHPYSSVPLMPTMMSAIVGSNLDSVVLTAVALAFTSLLQY
ncbi:hypothetical protein KC19_11G074400 [Ceratodon purpureus]|uniref:Uncharacterized protein n=1 Tax=Ceratodon purpureus TaxID=3225 RepID=A0A8T0GCI0_CERPU|nr:hypothetical protein KC19_11G074400 [Ceratodon purpureus]